MNNMEAVFPIIHKTRLVVPVQIAAEDGFMRRPVPDAEVAFLPRQAGKAAVDGHAVLHDKGNAAIGAGCGFVGACGDPDLRHIRALSSKGKGLL